MTTIELKEAISLDKRIGLRIDEQTLGFLKQYSDSEQSTMSEVMRGLMDNLHKREQRRNRKTVRVQEISPNQLTLFFFSDSKRMIQSHVSAF